jgi:anion-transporting  ArsA/GET3 family ATPase
VGGVIVNMVIDHMQVNARSPEFVKNRVAMQDRYMDEIWEKFDGMVRAKLPLYETEVRGVELLTRMAEILFA